MLSASLNKTFPSLMTCQTFSHNYNYKITIFLVANVLSEDTILNWYKKSHSPKGKSVFLEQMKKFVEWLENAEEGRFCNSSLLTCDLYGQCSSQCSTTGVTKAVVCAIFYVRWCM